MSVKLLVIVGPTASGKTELAIKIAKRYKGEIICADSRTVYKGLDIGTAKPTPEQRASVTHHLLDIVCLDEDFNVSDFKKLAQIAIDDIQSKGKLPIIVGGSGLYINSVIYNYDFSGPGSLRDKINPRHSDQSTPKHKDSLLAGSLIIGIDPPRAELRERITSRVESMINNGLVDELREALTNYEGSKALDAPAYKSFKDYILGNVSIEDAKNNVITKDIQLAKRQSVWNKRNRDIVWFNSAKEAFSWLNKEDNDKMNNYIVH